MSDENMLRVLLAEYCESEEQFDSLYAEMMLSKDVSGFVSFLLKQIKHVQPNAEANAVRKATAEADATAIRECYAILMKEDGKSTTEAVAELELAFNCSNSKVQAAIKDSDVNKGYEQLQRKSWVWYDYGPCLAEHKGNKSATYKELADRHDLSVSTIKRFINDDNILAEHFIRKNPNHGWVPYDKSYTPDFVWSGRLADLCCDYQKAYRAAEVTINGELVDGGSETHLEILRSLTKKYGFTLSQVEKLVEMYPRKLVYIDYHKGIEQNELCHRYRLTQKEVNELIDQGFEIERDPRYNSEVDVDEGEATILPFDEDRLALPEDGADDDIDDDYEDLDEGFDEDD